MVIKRMHMSKRFSILILLFIFSLGKMNAQNIIHDWDSIKATTAPVVTSAYSFTYGIPYHQPLRSYGWEDGIEISRDGLNLYALYSPYDLIGQVGFMQAQFANPNATVCSIFGNTDYMRHYAPTYGMDFTTNPFGCDSFFNIDIVYAHRNTRNDSFLTWQLSGLANPVTTEAGSNPIQNAINPNQLDYFFFTRNNDIWMITNTTVNPTGLATAYRLPTNINPDSTEFNADNPHVEAFGTDSLLLIFEKYTNPAVRDFYYSFSYDQGISWTNPVAITTISSNLGHIEHPHLYIDPQGQRWLWFSLDCDIWRAEQGNPNDWDSWVNPTMVVSKANSPCLGEPTLTADGDLSIAVAISNTVSNDTTDMVDIDPWYIENIANAVPEIPALDISVFYDAETANLNLNWNSEEPVSLCIYNLQGQLILQKEISGSHSANLSFAGKESGVYIAELQNSAGFAGRKKFVCH